METAPASDVIIDYNQKNHPIRVTKVAKTLSVRANGEEVLKTENAYLLDESGHKPVYYFPLKDAKPGTLTPSSTQTTCPYKGLARYYNLLAGGKEFKDAVWQYHDSNEDFAPIREYIAFYGNLIDGIDEL